MTPRAIFEKCSHALPLQFDYAKLETSLQQLRKVLRCIPRVNDEDDEKLMAVLSAVYCAMCGIEPDDASECCSGAEVLLEIYEIGYQRGNESALRYEVPIIASSPNPQP